MTPIMQNSTIKLLFSLAVLSLSLSGCNKQEEEETNQNVKEESIVRWDREGSSILKGVSVPASKRLFISSGQVSDPNFPEEAEGSLERYGDTYTQSKGCLEKIKKILEADGLGLEDVVYMGVFVAPDPMLEGRHDFGSWFQAYGEFYNNEDNPTKVARSTIGVAALARPYLLVEVEVIAVYP
jgi:enamine deaminase RidA (YjgF/YER057c/UK114 family)